MQDHRPLTFLKSFRKVSRKFAEKFLINEEYESLLSKIAFFKEHPKVNDKVLDHAVTIAILSSKDKLAHEIPSPLEVDIIRRRIEIFYRTIQ